MALARYKTAGEIIGKVGQKLGLGEVADPYSSTDPDYQRLVQLLTEVGQELAEDHEWNHLLFEKTYTGDGVTAKYDLPADFLAMVEQTGWNRTTQFPLSGPLSAQVWAYRSAVPTVPVYAEFRLDTNEIRFKPALGNGQVAAFEYRSRAWVRPAASGLGNGNTLGPSGADEPVVTGDYVLFDPLLARRALYLAWREDNGFETSKAQEALQRSLDRAKDRVQTAPVLRLSQRRRGLPLIGARNIPDGSWSV